jgi:hypothetical protein
MSYIVLHDTGLGQDEGQFTPSDENSNSGAANVSMLKGKTTREYKFGQNMRYFYYDCNIIFVKKK